jgi:transcriptional regulator with XRE-family HTH domain
VFDPIDQAFGDLVRRQRNALGLTQDELAARLGVSVQEIQDIEHGVKKASGSLVIRIARLGLDGAVSPPLHIDDLFADAVPEVPRITDMVEDFSAIRSPRVRRALLALLDGGGGGRTVGAPPMAASAPQGMSRWA